ncbi:MAG TPA: DUF4258 domain-containing protein [Polyangia bacterium]|jgi:hypothetical protein
MGTPAAALKAIKAAVSAGAWRPDPHLIKQMARRGLILADVVTAIESARRIQPHDMLPLNEGGESWRVYGEDTEGRLLGVGVELVADAEGDFVVVLTAFIEERK